MKIFVTGACGFIGSHLVEELVKRNFKVRGLVIYNSRNSNGWIDNLDQKILDNCEIVQGDIRDSALMNVYTKNVDVILHLAALVGIPYSYQAVQSYIETNITGTFNILNSAIKNNIQQVITTSTSEVYGTAQKVPILENHPLNAQSPYAASKIAADQLALSFYKSYNLPITILRPFNTFGPRQSARAIIPSIITQAICKKIVRLGNLTPTRDFTYIEDTVDAFIKAINKSSSYGEVINIGSNFEISIKDILNIIKKEIGSEFNVTIDKQRVRKKNSEVYRLFSSNIKAKKILRWKPRFSRILGFEKGLKKTIKWFSDPKNLKYYNPSIYNI